MSRGRPKKNDYEWEILKIALLNKDYTLAASVMVESMKKRGEDKAPVYIQDVMKKILKEFGEEAASEATEGILLASIVHILDDAVIGPTMCPSFIGGNDPMGDKSSFTGRKAARHYTKKTKK